MTLLPKIGFLFLLLSPNASAANRGIVEGVCASNSTILISTSTGRVAIGKCTTPGTALDVAGTIRQTGVTSCANGVTTDSNGGFTGCVSNATANFNISSNLDGTQLNNSVMGVCASTITVTFSGSPNFQVIETNGAITDTGVAGNFNIGFLMDGAFVSPLTKTKGFVGGEWPGANSTENASGKFVFQPSAGSHSYCLTASATGFNFKFGGGTANNSTDTSFYFMVYEIH